MIGTHNMKDCCVCNAPVEMPNENQFVYPTGGISGLFKNSEIFSFSKLPVICLYCIDDTINKPLVTNN